jgi:hypothetical protein
MPAAWKSLQQKTRVENDNKIQNRSKGACTIYQQIINPAKQHTTVDHP